MCAQGQLHSCAEVTGDGAGCTHLPGQDDVVDKRISLQIEHEDLGWADGREVVQSGDDTAVHHPQSVAPVYPGPVH